LFSHAKNRILAWPPSRGFGGKIFPLLAEEGWRDSLIEAGAPGAKREPDRAKPNYAKREPDRAKPQLMVSSAKSMGRRSDHPVCAFALLGAATPPLRGGEWELRLSRTAYPRCGERYRSNRREGIRNSFGRNS